MKNLLVLLLGVLLIGISCRKQEKTPINPPEVDSMDIHQVGGIAGFSLHFLIVDGAVYSDNTTYSYSNPGKYLWVKMPDEKYQEVKELLNSVPQQMFEDGSMAYGNNLADSNLADNMGGWTRAVKKGNVYYWSFGNGSPDYVWPFANKVSEAINELSR